MNRWWGPDGAAPSVLLTPTGTGDRGAVLLAAHIAGTRGCAYAANRPLPGEHDLDQVGEVVAELTGLDCDDAGARMVYRSAISKGVPPAVALRRAGEVYGVPPRLLGPYLAVAVNPLARPESLQDAADVALFSAVELAEAEVIGKAYDPREQRIPAGRTGAGQWTGGSDGAGLRPADFLVNMNPTEAELDEAERIKREAEAGPPAAGGLTELRARQKERRQHRADRYRRAARAKRAADAKMPPARLAPAKLTQRKITRAGLVSAKLDRMTDAAAEKIRPNELRAVNEIPANHRGMVPVNSPVVMYGQSANALMSLDRFRTRQGNVYGSINFGDLAAHAEFNPTKELDEDTEAHRESVAMRSGRAVEPVDGHLYTQDLGMTDEQMTARLHQHIDVEVEPRMRRFMSPTAVLIAMPVLNSPDQWAIVAYDPAEGDCNYVEHRIMPHPDPARTVRYLPGEDGESDRFSMAEQLLLTKVSEYFYDDENQAVVRRRTYMVEPKSGPDVSKAYDPAERRVAPGNPGAGRWTRTESTLGLRPADFLVNMNPTEAELDEAERIKARALRRGRAEQIKTARQKQATRTRAVRARSKAKPLTATPLAAGKLKSAKLAPERHSAMVINGKKIGGKAKPVPAALGPEFFDPYDGAQYLVMDAGRHRKWTAKTGGHYERLGRDSNDPNNWRHELGETTLYLLGADRSGSNLMNAAQARESIDTLMDIDTVNNSMEVPELLPPMVRLDTETERDRHRDAVMEAMAADPRMVYAVMEPSGFDFDNSMSTYRTLVNAVLPVSGALFQIEDVVDPDEPLQVIEIGRRRLPPQEFRAPGDDAAYITAPWVMVYRVIPVSGSVDRPADRPVDYDDDDSYPHGDGRLGDGSW